MENWQKILIIANLPKLIKLTTCSSTDLLHFIEPGILSIEDTFELLSINEEKKRKEALLLTLMAKKGAYESLTRALRHTSQTSALQIMESEQKAKNVALNLPRNFNDVKILKKCESLMELGEVGQLTRICSEYKLDEVNVNVRIPTLEEKNSLTRSKYTTEKGYALILNIVKFNYEDNSKIREGAIHDTDYMVKLWEGLGFKIFPKDGGFNASNCKSKMDIKNAVEDFKQMCMNNQVDSITVFISSDGFEDKLITTDGETLDVFSDIIYPLQFSKSDIKKKVAKIFITHSTYHDPPINYRKTHARNVEPDVTDTIYIKAHVPQYVGHHGETYRSSFVDVLSYVIMRNAYKSSLSEMLTEVQSRLKLVSGETTDGFREICQVYQIEFRFPFYFFHP